MKPIKLECGHYPILEPNHINIWENNLLRKMKSKKFWEWVEFPLKKEIRNDS